MSSDRQKQGLAEQIVAALSKSTSTDVCGIKNIINEVVIDPYTIFLCKSWV